MALGIDRRTGRVLLRSLNLLPALVIKRGSRYRLTPDMRITRPRTEHDVVVDGLGALT